MSSHSEDPDWNPNTYPHRKSPSTPEFPAPGEAGPDDVKATWEKHQCFIDGKPVLWEYPEGVIHACEGTTYHDERVFWTLCEMDVVPPPNAFTPDSERQEEVTCPRCIHFMEKA